MHPRLRFALVFVSTAVAAYLVAGCTGEADFYAATEVDEPGRIDLDNRGQTNCFAEAFGSMPTAACPLEDTGKPVPTQGVRVLDDFYIQPLGPSGLDSLAYYADNPDKGIACAVDVQRLRCTGPTTTLLSGSNTARASRGLLPDVILPGAGQFHAAYGWWNNVDNDAYIHVDDTGLGKNNAVTTGPNNEWVLKPAATVVSYIEPGTHPSYDGMARPSTLEPDIHYAPLATTQASTPVVYQQKDGDGDASNTAAILWLDGSVLRTITVTTVAEAHFAPSPDGTLPFTRTAQSRVDVDRYLGLAPGPISEAYGALAGPMMDEVASPSYGSCPNACAPGPVAVGGTALAPLLGPAQGSVYARHLPETREGSGNTAAGRQTEYEEDYRAFLDVIPATRLVVGPSFVALAWSPLMQVPLSAKPGSDDPTIPPGGFFAPYAWIGIWKDHSGDGFVGRVKDPSDPYEGGSRPQPNDFLQSRGEFYPVDPKLKDAELHVTLTPDTDWGPVGVYYLTGATPGDATARTAADCGYPSQAYSARLVFCPTVSAGSTKPILLVLDNNLAQASPSAGAAWIVPVMPTPEGHYGMWQPIWFPTGSPGFTMCTVEVRVKYTIGGEAREETVRDCDYIAPYAEA